MIFVDVSMPFKGIRFYTFNMYIYWSHGILYVIFFFFFQSESLVVCDVAEDLVEKLRKFRFRKETNNAAIISKLKVIASVTWSLFLSYSYIEWTEPLEIICHLLL